MHKVEDLIIWKKSIDLTKDIYLLVSEVSADEKFGLISQIKKSAVSIPSNIAEGDGRNSNKEFKHFLGIANGSCYELQTQLIRLYELSLINNDKITPLIDLCIEIQKNELFISTKIINLNT